MAINNDAVYNAAFIGALSGMLSGRDFDSSTATDYATQVNAADAFALQLDSLIAENASISTGGGNASMVAPTTSAIVFTQSAYMHAISQLSCAQFNGRAASSATQSFYTTAAAAVNAALTQALTKITNAA